MTASSKRFLLLCLLLAAGIVLPFLIWGESFEKHFSLEGSREWMEGFGRHAWLAGILLLVGDIVLPIPGTIVMSALGWKYGWLLGGLISSAGAFCAGSVAYLACRHLGRPAARWIAGEESLEKAHRYFEKRGVWIVALSRWLPVLTEAIACLAGLASMPRRQFFPALLIGSLPMGFAFAAIGHLGHHNPAVAIALSALLPLGFILLTRKHFKA